MINMATQRYGSSYERALALAGRKIPNGSRSSFQEALLARTDKLEIKRADENTGAEDSQRMTLTSEEISELAAKYGKDMSDEEYDAFLEELVDKGVLTNDEILYLGYKGCIIYSPGSLCPCYRCDEYGNPLEDAYGDSLEWIKTMSQYVPKSLQNAGLFLYAENSHHESFETLADVLGRMDAQSRY